MASGKVKWFDNRRGFGFIAQEAGQDVFVHHTSILGKGFKSLVEGEDVSFDLVDGTKSPMAQNVRRGPTGPVKSPSPEIHRGLPLKKRSGSHRAPATPAQPVRARAGRPRHNPEL